VFERSIAPRRWPATRRGHRRFDGNRTAALPTSSRDEGELVSRAPTAFSSKGILDCRRPRRYTRALAGWKLNPDTQIVATRAPKRLRHVARRSPRRATSCGARPSYPIHAFGFLWRRRHSLGAVGPTPEFFTILEARHHALDPGSRSRWWCAPSNPTAHVASLDFYKELVPFAKKQEIFILSDLGLCRGLFRQQPAAVGAAGQRRDGPLRRVHLDVEDLFDARWRMGFAVGNERIISALSG